MAAAVRVEESDGIVIATLDRPPVNALTTEMQDEITAAFEAISASETARCAVLTGAGRIFCAGADIKVRAASPKEGALAAARGFRACAEAVAACTKPVIAAINGPALGGGLVLAASADMLICAEGATLGLPEIDVGLLGGGRHTMRLFGHSRARRMMFTGYRVSAEEAARLGIVEACVRPARLMSEALALAAEIAGKSAAAIRLAKQGMNAIEAMSLHDGYRFEQSLTAELARHPDSQAAMAAFVERTRR